MSFFFTILNFFKSKKDSKMSSNEKINSSEIDSIYFLGQLPYNNHQIPKLTKFEILDIKEKISKKTNKFVKLYLRDYKDNIEEMFEVLCQVYVQSVKTICNRMIEEFSSQYEYYTDVFLHDKLYEKVLVSSLSLIHSRKLFLFTKNLELFLLLYPNYMKKVLKLYIKELKTTCKNVMLDYIYIKFNGDINGMKLIVKENPYTCKCQKIKNCLTGKAKNSLIYKLQRENRKSTTKHDINGMTKKCKGFDSYINIDPVDLSLNKVEVFLKLLK